LGEALSKFLSSMAVLNGFLIFDIHSRFQHVGLNLLVPHPQDKFLTRISI